MWRKDSKLSSHSSKGGTATPKFGIRYTSSSRQMDRLIERFLDRLINPMLFVEGYQMDGKITSYADVT